MLGKRLFVVVMVVAGRAAAYAEDLQITEHVRRWTGDQLLPVLRSSPRATLILPFFNGHERHLALQLS